MPQQKSTGLPQPSPHADEIGVVARSRAHQMATTRKRAAVSRRVAYFAQRPEDLELVDVVVEVHRCSS